MSSRFWIALGAISAAISVGLGAYHAHGLENMLLARGLNVEELLRQMHSFDVGVRYQMFHALAIILIGLMTRNASSRCLNTAGGLFVAGTFLFSGSLYIPVLAGIKLPWYLVPSGGTAFIAGWIVLAVSALLQRPQS